MGYVLILLFFLIWLNVRKIRKTLVVIAKDYGYKKNSLFNYILDVITDYSAELKQERKDRNHTRKLRKLSKKKEAEENVPPEPEPETPESKVQDETSYS